MLCGLACTMLCGLACTMLCGLAPCCVGVHHAGRAWTRHAGNDTSGLPFARRRGCLYNSPSLPLLADSLSGRALSSVHVGGKRKKPPPFSPPRRTVPAGWTPHLRHCCAYAYDASICAASPALAEGPRSSAGGAEAPEPVSNACSVVPPGARHSAALGDEPPALAAAVAPPLPPGVSELYPPPRAGGGAPPPRLLLAALPEAQPTAVPSSGSSDGGTATQFTMT
eukprot:365670-Chlamydomonas_euryale.AAC.5